MRYWDESCGVIVCRVLGMPVCNIATAKTLFNALEQKLAKRSIPWSNVLGFASDIASVIVGKRNSVPSHVLERQQNIFSLGCVCHLSTMGAAASLPLSIDQLLIIIM